MTGTAGLSLFVRQGDADRTPRRNVAGNLSFGAYPLERQGVVVFGLPLPNDPALFGVEFSNQGLITDPTANPGGMTASNGGRGVVRS